MNSVDHKGFLMFLSHWELLSELPPAMFKRVMQAIFSAAGADCAMPENMELVERIAFTALSGDVQRSLDKYDERRRKCATAGSKGGRRKAENAAEAKSDEDALAGLDHASDAGNNAANASDARNDVANYSDARNCLANLAKEKDKATDKAMVTDKAKAKAMAKAMAMDKENKKPLSVVDAAAPDQTAACAAEAAPHTEAPPLSAARTEPSHAQPSPKAVNAHFEALWALYPIKRGKNQVSKRAKRQLMSVDIAAMQTAIARYVAEVEASAFDRQWLNGSTWFNGRYLDYLGEGYVPPPASGVPASARSRETSYRSAEEARACAARYAALEE